MAIGKKPSLLDIDKEDRVTMRDAIVDSGPHALDLRPGADFTAADGVPIPKKDDLASPGLSQHWAEQELVKATPRAVQELIAQLRKGDKKERFAAAVQILDRTGVQVKENRGNQAPVIVLTQKVIQNIPWARKLAKEAGKLASDTTVEGKVVNDQKDRP